MSGLIKVAEVNGAKIEYSFFYEQHLVLLPKGNGTSEMHRFDTKEEAIEFAEANTKTYWWQK